MSGLSLDNLVIPYCDKYLGDQKYQSAKKALSVWWWRFSISSLVLFLYVVPITVFNFLIDFDGKSDAEEFVINQNLLVLLCCLVFIFFIVSMVIYFKQVRGKKNPFIGNLSRQAFAMIYPIVMDFNARLERYSVCPLQSLPEEYVEAKFKLLEQQHRYLEKTIELFANGAYGAVIARMNAYLKF